MIFTGNVKSWDNLDLIETLAKKEIQQCCFVQESAGNGIIGVDHVGAIGVVKVTNPVEKYVDARS